MKANIPRAPSPVLGRGFSLLKTVQGVFGGGEKPRGHDTGREVFMNYITRHMGEEPRGHDTGGAAGNDKDQESTHQSWREVQQVGIGNARIGWLGVFLGCHFNRKLARMISEPCGHVSRET